MTDDVRVITEAELLEAAAEYTAKRRLVEALLLESGFDRSMETTWLAQRIVEAVS